MVELIIGAIVLVVLAGVATYFWSSARASEARALAEAQKREAVEGERDAARAEVTDLRRQLATELAARQRAEATADELRGERDRLQAELGKLAPGDARLKSTLAGGV